MTFHHRTGAALLAALALSACLQRPPVPETPKQADLSAEIVTTRDDTAPTGPDGACWATDSSPAVIETVTEQVQVTPEERAEDGSITAPASYRTKTHTRMLRDRQVIWFRAPCPIDMTPDFIATLQRALKARGYYLAPLTGTLDAATVDAIRRFQTERGLASRQLSLAAARELGIVPTELDAL
ncbi:peptidoglycan-binding domain-containing protein [Paragemmobacter straminiformis]|uniref:Peptidoglycan-binding protein n=1 Tax=Paragemmobacter straminiformis TaxID=2045119 RepID=A0A842I2C0_9RHOB|nr:peptidoglycan-binding domain-containing protein [Gemmobacter straminiformis]MBC2833939.1 peptidoglycan-binding protein [Gemmobacter straminiformis]